MAAAKEGGMRGRARGAFKGKGRASACGSRKGLAGDFGVTGERETRGGGG